MRIAVVENDSTYIELLKKNIDEESMSYPKAFVKNENDKIPWETDYFQNSTEFGKVKLSQYQIIVANYNLPEISGLSLLKSVSKKSSAALALMCEHDIYQKDNVKEKVDESISAVFDKQNITKITDWFYYIEAKMRINEMVEKEETNLANIALATSGYNVHMKNDIAIFGITHMAELENKTQLITLFKKAKYRIVAYFTNGDKVNSSQLNTMIQWYKTAEEHDGKLVFWNKKQDQFALKVIYDCALDRIIKIFDDLDIAINYLKDKNNW